MPGAQDQNSFPAKVLFVISSLGYGGAEKYLVDLANNLDRKRFRPAVCVLHRGSMIPEIAHDVPIFDNLARWAGDPRELLNLIQIMKAQSPAIAVLVGRDNAVLWGGIAARLARVPITVQSLHHGSLSWRQPKFELYHLVNRSIDSWTDSFVTVSDTQRKMLVKMGLPAKRTIIIHNGIDPALFDCGQAARAVAREKLGLSLHVPVIGTVANFRPVKRYDLLLAALARLKTTCPSIHYLVIGDGQMRPRIEEMAQQLGVFEAVTFLGQRADVAALLPALDVFALASDAESFSIAIIEAMAAGIPIVSTDCGGPSEIIADGETGFLTPLRQPAILADKIQYLLCNPTVAGPMGSRARQRVIENYSLAKMVSRHENLFTELLDKKSSVNFQ